MGNVHKNSWLPVYDRKDDDYAMHHVQHETLVEIYRIKKKYGPHNFNSWHEAFAVIKEELDEFWDSVKENDPDPSELIQVAACAQLAIVTLCDKRREEREK